MTDEPIAIVSGYFGGRCVVQALDPSVVLPAGMALYAAPQPVVDEGTTTPPCDCIENVNGRWVQSCECRNAGDLLSAQDWCAHNNLLSAGAVATPQPVVRYTHAETQQLIEIMCPEESHHLHRCRSELLSAGKETDRG